ncbi:MAG: hypothetical protein ACPGVT_11360 [Maricaulaceae bacterium]
MAEPVASAKAMYRGWSPGFEPQKTQIDFAIELEFISLDVMILLIEFAGHKV